MPFFLLKKTNQPTKNWSFARKKLSFFTQKELPASQKTEILHEKTTKKCQKGTEKSTHPFKNLKFCMKNWNRLTYGDQLRRGSTRTEGLCDMTCFFNFTTLNSVCSHPFESEKPFFLLTTHPKLHQFFKTIKKLKQRIVMLRRIKRRRLIPTVNEMMATHKNAVVIANIRLSKEYLARVNLQEKGLESAEIILQVN